MPAREEDYYNSLSNYGWSGPQQVGGSSAPPATPASFGGGSFDSNAYWDVNPDVAGHSEFGRNVPGGAAAHYEQYGRNEGRNLAPAPAGPSPYDFDPEAYVGANPSLQTYMETHPDFDPSAHWDKFGQEEGRKSGQSDLYNYYSDLDPSIQEEFRSFSQEEQNQYINYEEPDPYPTPTNEFINTELPLPEYDVSQEAFEGSPDYLNMMNQMERQRKESTSMASARGYRNDPRLQLELNRRAAQEAQLGYQTFRGNTRQLYGDQYNREIDQYNMDRGEFGDYYNRLAGIAGVGQTATAGINTLGAGFANNSAYVRGNAADYYGNALNYAGGANAAGTLAQGDAWGEAAGEFGDWWAKRKKPTGGPVWEPEFPPYTTQ